MKFSQWLFASLLFTQPLGGLAHGQGLHGRAWSSNVVIPQARAYATGRTPALQITAVVAGVVVRDQVATSVLEVRLRNPGSTRQEAELLVPVPDKAVVRGFTFQGTGAEPSARLLPREEARRLTSGSSLRPVTPHSWSSPGLISSGPACSRSSQGVLNRSD